MFATRALPALFSALVLSTAALADPVTFDTAQGPMELSAAPERIVALDPAAIDTLVALGQVPAGISWPVYVDYLPDQVEGAEHVGSFFEPDFEAIAALAPDLIVVGSRAVAQAQALSRIAPVADMSVGTDAFGDGEARLAAYGRMLGREAAADELSAALDAKVEQVRALVADKGGDALILMTNGPKLAVFGPGSRFGWLHTRLGFGEAVEGIADSRHGEAVSFEYIAQANPDTLIVIDRGAAIDDGTAAAQATLDNSLVAGTTAGREGRIVYLSPGEVYIAAGGVQALMRTLDEIAAALGAM
ncbi:siderophore ABC transporter substrate-binding protein [Pseudooceanicola sp. LIPI14-2-Ac024]|uniref:siderophore ABC transporter substrate-binding protein n=1 Tax=Pseudooceanicola sp. LIPI14-2-Ac024 TaxID=3344875 RepID=UPI0035CEA714